jgi:N-acetylated-alpha-linked acidic dipeptidase
VQRGSVLDMPLYPGDPLTPGAGATKDARRLRREDAASLARIPVLPISYADAQPLMAALRGPVAPENWRGALPITYHVGPGPARVHLKLKASWDLKPAHDVIARIPGSTFPDEWIVRGNHHDAWVNGADDPVSALVAMLEEARALSELRKQGWQPKRTIVYAAWGAEEQALLGSTEWAEAHADELGRNAAVYLNTDSNGRGFLSFGASHTLEKFMNGVARDIEDPETRLSVWKRMQLARIANGTAEARREARERPDLRAGALGAGSDYTVFVHHLGVASVNLGFGGFDRGGIYHSIYDDFYWYTRYSDSDFSYGRALAQTVGTAVMRLAGADVLPFAFTNFADTVRRYSAELQKLLKDKQEEVREHNRQIDEGVFAATTDPKEKSVPPQIEEVPPHLNFAPLENAIDRLSRSADQYEKALLSKWPAGDSLRALNRKLIETERRLTDARGLPNRPWYKHQIYAPGWYTGYSAKTLPGVREAIEQKRWKDAEAEIVRVAAVLAAEAALIDSAVGELR